MPARADGHYVRDDRPDSETSNRTAGRTSDRLDPLYVIFEQHLYNFQDSDSDRKTFIGNIVKDYLAYLRRMNIMVPKSLEASVVEELASQVNTMLVKKIYGCLSLQDYRQKVPKAAKRRVKAQYTRLATQKTIPAKTAKG